MARFDIEGVEVFSDRIEVRIVFQQTTYQSDFQADRTVDGTSEFKSVSDLGTASFTENDDGTLDWRTDDGTLILHFEQV